MVSKNQGLLEVELDNGCNGDVHFNPIGRKLRGKIDWSTIERQQGAERAKEWGGPIRGQIIAVDPGKRVGYVKEPVRQNAKQKALAEKKGFKLAPEVEEFPNINPEKWLRAIGRLVESGFAKVLKGTPPEVKPIVEKPTPIELLAASTYASLSPEKKAEADALIADFRR